MKEALKQIEQNAVAELERCGDLKELENLRGKKAN